MPLPILHKVLRYYYPVFLLHYLNNLLDKAREVCYLLPILTLTRGENHATTYQRRGRGYRRIV